MAAVVVVESTRRAPGAAPERPRTLRRAHPRRYQWLNMLPMGLVHLFPFAALWVGVSWQAALWGVALYVVRMFAITAGFHRYFSHRTFRTSRTFQLILAVVAQSAGQRSVIWWAAHHRNHHKNSDQPGDSHSPRQDGFWYAHVGWIFNRNDAVDWRTVKDLTKYPELVWLDRYWWVPVYGLGALSALLFGWSGLFFGFGLSTVLVWHCTFFINSLTHIVGARRFDTPDDSKNSWLMALLTFGEGWHNNHHHYMHSTRQGFYWWELDVTYYALWVLERLRIVWQLRPVPPWVYAHGRLPVATVDGARIGAAH